MRPVAFEHDLSQRIDRAQPALLFDGSTPDELAEAEPQVRRCRCRLPTDSDSWNGSNSGRRCA
jgi:hypothetical protein